MPVNQTDTLQEEVLGNKPAWFIRYGNTLLLIIVLACGSFAAIIHYPEVMEGKVLIQHNPDGYMITARMPVYGTGKIKPGQQVYITLDKYPAPEFGELLATVKAAPVQDTTGMTMVQLSLTAGLQSSRGKTLEAGQCATGACNIVIAKERIIKKLLKI